MLAYRMPKKTWLGERIRQAREAKGWSQDALADELGTKQATVARWETGSFPKRIGLPRIAEALGKPVEWFQRGASKNPTKSDTDPSDDDLTEKMAELERRLKAMEEKAPVETTDAVFQKLSKAWPGAHPAFRAALCYLLTGDEGDLALCEKSIRNELRLLRTHLPRTRRASGG